MKQCLQQRNIDPANIIFINGWYNKTLTQKTAEKIKLDNLGIVFVDCDTYSSSRLVLEFIQPYITRPVIICFDDWRLYDLDVIGMGEYKSFNEFLEEYPHLKATPIRSYNRKSRSFLIQPITGVN